MDLSMWQLSAQPTMSSIYGRVDHDETPNSPSLFNIASGTLRFGQWPQRVLDWKSCWFHYFLPLSSPR